MTHLYIQGGSRGPPFFLWSKMMNRKITAFLLGVSGTTLIISISMLALYLVESSRQSELYRRLASSAVPFAAESSAGEGGFLPEYESLYQSNPDMVGWICIEGTKINYPVMQTPADPNYYLKHNFERSYTDYGCPFVQADCNVQRPSDNLIIYGHNMKDGSLFADLTLYEDPDFWQAHKVIRFDTLAERREYEVLFVFKTVVDAAESAFPFYRFIDAESAGEFNEYISACKDLALYETDPSAEYGDKLITLSTCEYSQENGRLIVVAKRIIY